MMTCRKQTPFWFIRTLTFCITFTMIEMSYSPTEDSALFVPLRNFDGYLHKTYNLTGLTPVASITDCARVCKNNQECGSFFYLEKPQKLCQTHSVIFATTDEAENVSGASYYQLTQDRCPYERGYLLYRPSSLCYQMFNKQDLVKADAITNCQVIQGHLLDVKTETISKHLVKYVNSSPSLRNYNVFVGAGFVNGTWIWSDGTEVTWSNWDANEPNNLLTEQCVSASVNSDLKWNNIQCDVKRNYICQLDI